MVPPCTLPSFTCSAPLLICTHTSRYASERRERSRSVRAVLSLQQVSPDISVLELKQILEEQEGARCWAELYSGDPDCIAPGDVMLACKCQTALQTSPAFVRHGAGIPVKQQVICFGGQHLKDHASIREYNLDEFTLSDEVVLYLSSRLSSPKAIFLTSWSKPSQLVQEHVEADMPVGEVSRSVRKMPSRFWSLAAYCFPCMQVPSGVS